MTFFAHTCVCPDRSWYLLPYQLNSGLPSAINLHIQAGIDAAAADESALLVFSGGQSRREVSRCLTRRAEFGSVCIHPI